MDEQVNRLKKICIDVVADKSLKPKTWQEDGIDETYCNTALIRITSRLGYSGFQNLMANDIYDVCAKGQDWDKVEGKWAAEFALTGGLAVAAQKGEAHGHCALVYPAEMFESGSWKKLCPMVANVGKQNGIMSASKAFRTEPDYFILKAKS